MNRETAIVEFFRACLDEDEVRYRKLAAVDDPVQQDWCLNKSGDYNEGYIVDEALARLRDVEADRKLLERYDYCVSSGRCPGNETLDAAREEYEDHIFPLRIARFSDHPAHAALVANRWVYEDYAAAVGPVTL